MKKGWTTKRLGELAEIELGKTPARATASFWDEKKTTDNVWLSIADLLNAEDNVVSDSKEYISDKGAALCSIVRKGTLLVSFKLTLGRLAFTGRDLYTNEAIAALTLFNEREVSKEYLFWFLQFFDWQKAAEGDVKIKGMTLNKAKLKEIAIEFPPLAEQQRIVGVLDEAFAGLATAQAHAAQNLQNARALFESHLQSVFTHRGKGWVEKRLEGLATIRTGKRDANHQVENGPYPFYTCAIGQFRSPTFSFDGPSIILPGNGANVGKIFFHDGKFEAYQRTYVVNELNQAINPRFLFYCFNANWPGWIATKQFGAATNYIVVGDLKAFPVPVPALDIQEENVVRLDALAAETQRLTRLYEQKQAALAALKKSLLHQAFSGAL